MAMTTSDQLAVLSDLFEDAGYRVEPYSGNAVSVGERAAGGLTALIVLTYRAPRRGGTRVSVEGTAVAAGSPRVVAQQTLLLHLRRILQQVGYEASKLNWQGDRYFFDAAWSGTTR
jgi:hypothetical protein